MNISSIDLHSHFHADIDECLQGSNNCHDNAICINLMGSYRCECKPGYSGNGFICIGKLLIVHDVYNIHITVPLTLTFSLSCRY